MAKTTMSRFDTYGRGPFRKEIETARADPCVCECNGCGLGIHCQRPALGCRVGRIARRQNPFPPRQQ